MNELKPCPFCGGEASLGKDYSDYESSTIGCLRCRSNIGWCSSEEKAVGKWNTRTEVNQSLPKEEVMCRILKEMEYFERCLMDKSLAQSIRLIYESQLAVLKRVTKSKEGVDLVSNGTFQNDKDWNTLSLKVPKEEVGKLPIPLVSISFCGRD